MPIPLNFLERSLFLTLNQGPAPILDLWSALAFRAVMAAQRLGVFEALAAGPATAAELAPRLGADPRGLTVLLEALAPLGYLERRDGGYTNSAMTNRWLTAAGDANFAPYMRFWDDVMTALWQTPEASVVAGKPPINLYGWIAGQPQTSQYFQEGMVALAATIAEDVTAGLKFLGGARRLLDVGGGHGAYSVALCRAYPQLSATIFDAPGALATGQQVVAAAGLDHRISFQPGDFLDDDLGEGFDALLLFNILHGFQPDQNLALFQKAAKALNPGGSVVVLEQLADAKTRGAAQAINGLLALSYFHTLGGQVYRFQDITGWLQQAGFGPARRLGLRKAPGSSLIIAVK